jgi:predicted RNase H-like HicB family nuclease
MDWYNYTDWYRDNSWWRAREMKTYTAVVEQCPDTGLYVGYVPGFPGAHSQGETLDELNRNLREVIEMLLEEGEPELKGHFIGTQTVTVP